MGVSQVQVPQVDLWSFLFERADVPFPVDREIFTCPVTKRAYTYADVKEKALRFGHNLKQQWKWQQGDILALSSPNCIDTPIVSWGCHYAGGVVTPANPSFSADDLRRQLDSSGAKALVIHSSKIDIGLEAARKAGLAPERVLYVGEMPPDRVPAVRHFSAMTDVLSKQEHRDYVPAPTDTAYLVYSSGTTGLPKGGMVTHRNVVAAVTLQSIVDGANISGPEKALLAVLPTFHIYGLVCLVHLPIYLGIRTYMMKDFSLDFFCRCVQDLSITHSYVAPPVINHFAKSPVITKYNLSSLRMLTSGGAPLSKELVDGVYRRVGIPVRQAYGLTETTAVSHIQLWHKWFEAPGSNGPPLVGLEAKFVNEEGNAASIGQQGELWIRGPTIFKGYLNNPGATKDTLTSDGWLRTGDIGYEDENRNMFVTDRAKELIKYKGFQIGPAELEGVLQGHGNVSDVAVVGVENADIASEVPLAYIVLKASVPPSEEAAKDIIDFSNQRMGPYKRLRGGIIWTDVIPKSASGKILRRVLKQRAAQEGKNAVGAVVYNLYNSKL